MIRPSAPTVKSRAEYVDRHFRTVSFECQDRIAVAILDRLALRIQARVAQPLASLLVAKSHRDVQQAHALHVLTDEVVCGIAFRFKPLKARIGVVQFLLQSLS